MSVKTPSRNKRTDPRPNYFALGVDETGAHHCYCTKDDTVYVVDDGELDHTQELGQKCLDEWMGFVDGRRGWASRRYGRSLVERFVEAFDEVDDE